MTDEWVGVGFLVTVSAAVMVFSLNLFQTQYQGWAIARRQALIGAPVALAILCVLGLSFAAIFASILIILNAFLIFINMERRL